MNENVREYEEMMSLYLDGRCTPEQEALLAAWVGENPENAREYHRFRNVWEAEHPAFRYDSIGIDKAKEQAVDAARENRPRYSERFLRCWKKVAAVLLFPLLAIGATLVYEYCKVVFSEPVWQSFTAPYGVYANLTLPDNSKVCLNSGSTLRYPSRFKGGRRSVSLEGEAYFEVQSDKDHPFSVNVGDMEVKATGTEFNIEAYPMAAQRVTLVAGKLDVSLPKRTYSLPQGCQLLHDLDNSVSCSRTDTFKWTSWRTGTLAFRGDHLSYVFGRLSSLYDVEIKIMDPKVSDYQIRATFRNERLDEMMSLIEQTTPIRCKCHEHFEDGIRKVKYQIYSK